MLKLEEKFITAGDVRYGVIDMLKSIDDYKFQSVTASITTAILTVLFVKTLAWFFVFKKANYQYILKRYCDVWECQAQIIKVTPRKQLLGK